MSSEQFEIVLLATLEEARQILDAPSEALLKHCVQEDSLDYCASSALPSFPVDACALPEELGVYYDSDDAPAFSRAEPATPNAPPPWLIGFSKQFLKDTAGLDRKLMGRILEALEELSSYGLPLAPHGDTFKPLKGEMRDCWRYRLGDHRLVIRPDVRRRAMDALTIAARGSVYD